MTPQHLLRLADQCVKCGLCLPHCPTYAVLAQEADSPRGRISLIQGWASGHLDLTPALESHLDRCLGCRACERVCPSRVDYGRLTDGADAARQQQTPRWRRLARRLRLALLADSRYLDWVRRTSWLYVHSGAARLAEVSGLARLPWTRPWHRLAGVIPSLARALRSVPAAQADLELFVGCSGALTQGAAVESALALYAALGMHPRIAPPPRCCGASARHNGLPERADRLRAESLNGDEAVPIVGLASACIAELGEAGSRPQVLELCDHLERDTRLERLSLGRVDATCLVHEPCSHRHLLGGNGAVLRLLGRIPGLDLHRLDSGYGCCGAAGTYLLDQPRMARVLLDDRLAAIVDVNPDYLVTTNPGCALHLAAGIREAGLTTRVRHPVELIRASVDRGETPYDRRNR